MAGRERPLDPGLAGEQPVERPVQLVLVGALDATRRAQGALSQGGGGGELGGRGDQAGSDQGDGEVTAARRAPVEERRQPQGAGHPEDRGDVAMGQAAADGECPTLGQEAFALQRALDELDDRGG